MNRGGSILSHLLALTLFVFGSGGSQLADALVYHRGHATRPVVPHFCGEDGCHSERCDLGAPQASVTATASFDVADVLLLPVTVVATVPSATPRVALFLGRPLGSRAPPLSS